uniref:Ectonucleotide pyrophosphatase/phosphodiesterase 1 n=1 Tax=Fundulus heteroclitus TaxID=8078 RepID=A0A3Q2Q3B4_FUNHE
MEVASCERGAFVSTYQQDTSKFDIVRGPAARIRPKRLPEDYFSCGSPSAACRVPDQPMRPYLKENLPKRMHFANNKRIERGHLYMKEGWQASFLVYFFSKKQSRGCFFCKHANSIFIGYGPGFKTNTVVAPFENIEIYNLMCDLLGIHPSPNNGTHGSLNHLLKHPFYRPVYPAQLSHETPCEGSNALPTDSLKCLCPSQNPLMTEMNTKLLSMITKDNLRRRHHPFGTPAVVQADISFCLLYHSNYLSGYSRDRLTPLWVSYTLPPLVSAQLVRDPSHEGCVRADVRVPSSSDRLCHRYRNQSRLSYGLLHPPCECDYLLYSALFFHVFSEVWTHFHTSMLLNYSQELNGVNVISGPIYDVDFDGNADPVISSSNETAVPTHFFVIMTTCGNSLCEGPLRAISFIMPHAPDYREFCASDLSWVEEWLRFHTARVRDIELLTGLSFYHGRISVEETIQLKTFLHTG